MSRLLALALAAVIAASCGYRLAGVGPNLPTQATTIAIKPFTNRTREHGLEIALQRAIEEEFRRRGPLAVVDEPGGDVVLSGTIRRFGSPAVAFAAGDEAVRYQGILQVSMRLRERSTGRIIFRTPLMQESLDFAATSGVLIPGSPRFQLGTIDARDLIQFTNVQLIEARRREALNQLVDLMARDVYLQAMEGF